jgi:hypothetical protein
VAVIEDCLVLLLIEDYSVVVVIEGCSAVVVIEDYSVVIVTEGCSVVILVEACRAVVLVAECSLVPGADEYTLESLAWFRVWLLSLLFSMVCCSYR